eukprot:COSAG06_NODE_71530_length_182_cov_1421.891566_1_plen_22_part_10
MQSTRDRNAYISENLHSSSPDA